MSDVRIPLGFTAERLVACAERELRMRERVYPGWVARGSMKAETSADEIAAMRAVVDVLRQLGAPPVPAAQGTLIFGGDGGRKA